MSPTRITCAMLACLLAAAMSLLPSNAQEAASQQPGGTIRLDVVACT